eukprot:CAMPEP_0197033308 /NCGR_PEP_ID=MMETSP1384-20130603/11747_1 /TAXON_ID=29189 /ORGANISM="Ammonia sp." /LENGTH=971 /DNA_ID=CAMNT_0042463099 /DNA_START=24 /DNA_END=2939 /DNA_ORIENTATION=+
MSDSLQRALKQETTDDDDGFNSTTQLHHALTDLRESQLITEQDQSRNSVLDAIDISSIQPTPNDYEQDEDGKEASNNTTGFNPLQLSFGSGSLHSLRRQKQDGSQASGAHSTSPDHAANRGSVSPPRRPRHHTQPVTPNTLPTYHASMTALHDLPRHERKSDATDTAAVVDEEDGIDFLRIWIQREKQDRDTAEVRNVCRKLQTACMMRERWVYKDKHGHYPSCLIDDEDICLNINIVQNALPKKSNHVFESKHGVFRVFKLRKTRKLQQSSNSHNNNEAKRDGDGDEADFSEEDLYEFVRSDEPLFHVHSFGEFMKDLCFLMELIMDGPARTFCYQRLQTLQAKFRLHVLLNENNEASEVRRVPHRDFYNIRKVDNHIHHSACMTQKHLLRFIKSRLKRHGDDQVYKNEKTQRVYTLKQLFHELNLTSYDLSIDTLSMHGHRDTFHRFDRFNRKYNPIGESSLRQVFLKIDNYAKGRYIADITKEVFDDLKESKYQYSELRLSIYGKKSSEWDILAAWICDNNLHCSNSRWMIQIPRLYSVYRSQNMVSDFGAMLDNIFRPLFEVTIDPRSHPKLHLFLNLVAGFDTVDDESIRENTRYDTQQHVDEYTYPEPSQWTKAENPPYIVWSYYIYANLCVLNQLRESRGMNAFSYRPHSGEAGDADHVAAAFLLAQSINHGLTLKRAPVLQYLYYLKQIGLSMSPLSNNLLFVEYDRNPLQLFFQRGLNVTLSTDDPLIIHYTKDPLIEEYAIAAQVYKLSAIDMCEIARNSVLQSGFPLNQKRHWVGTHGIFRRGVAGNNVKQTNVPDIRLLFRDELLSEEENWILGLPPPIFPSITLKSKHRKGKAKKSKYNNFLIEHRTKVPLKLQSPNFGAVDKEKEKEKGTVGNIYDPLRYFEYAEKRNILSHTQYLQQVEQKEKEREKEKEKVAWNSPTSSHYLRSFSLLAVGVLLGVAVTAIINNASKKNSKQTKE